MKTNNIIPFASCRTPSPADGIDLSAYERRGLRRYRRASVCTIAATVVDCLISVVIGICVVISTLVFFTML